MSVEKIIEWMQKYLAENADGQWEHDYGIEIGSTDNPGWYIKIDLSETELEGRKFESTCEDRGDGDWITITQDGNVLLVSGGVKNLSELLERVYLLMQ